MFMRFISLEWKAFTRASSFNTNLVLKIFMILGAIYFTLIFLSAGILTFMVIQETGQDPLVVVNKYMVYYLLMDLLVRIFLQKIPVINIRPLLPLPIERSTMVNFALGKTAVSFFNFVHAFFFLPFYFTLLAHEYDPLHATFWLAGMTALIYVNNFLNLLLNGKDWLFLAVIILIAGIGALQYYEVSDVTQLTSVVFQGFYGTAYMFLLALAALAGLWLISYRYFYRHLYLDTGLRGKHEVAQTQDFAWLNRYGTLGTFLKNDIKLIFRNKRSKTTLLMSFLFLFYGMLFMTGAVEAYDNTYMKIFAGIFVSGGFLFTFGQFVPSWDSAYYPLMMSQNIQYREYISSKWWLVVIGTAASTLLASFYLYFGVETYLIIATGAIYNIGINSHLVLLGGAYIKTPIDLASSKQAFGDKKAFNVQTLLLAIPKLLLPILLFVMGNALIGPVAGYAFVAGAGVLGLAFKNKVFAMTERVYMTEKYKTLAAYKQKN